MTQPLQPLAGHVVVDLSQNLPGPLLTRVLCDLGAQVIKIEPPSGEGLRWLPPQRDGVGAAFAALNAGKQSVAVDLKKPEGQALVRALIARADVLVETFRPGVLSRLGLDPEGLRADHPRLIVCSISGYGTDSPMAAVAGHDINYLARAGLLGLQGPPDQPPQVPMAQIADVGGGAYPAAIGVLSALLERDQTGTGRHLDIAMARSVSAFSPVRLASALSGGGMPRGQEPLVGAVPCYRCYRTSDGRYLSVGALEPRFWQTLCATVERPDLVARQYDPSPDAHAAVEALFAAHSQEVWVERLRDQDVCVEPVRTPAEAMSDPAWDPQVRYGGTHPVFPLHIGAPVPDAIGPVSSLGDDLDAVCAALEIDAETLHATRSAGATR